VCFYVCVGCQNLDNFAADLCKKYFPEEEKSFNQCGGEKGKWRISKGGVGVREVVQETPVGPYMVAVVSAPTSPR